jgi:hypothetical protein
MDELLIATMTGHGRAPARRGGRAATSGPTAASRGSR